MAGWYENPVYIQLSQIWEEPQLNMQNEKWHCLSMSHYQCVCQYHATSLWYLLGPPLPFSASHWQIASQATLYHVVFCFPRTAHSVFMTKTILCLDMFVRTPWVLDLTVIHTLERWGMHNIHACCASHARKDNYCLELSRNGYVAHCSFRDTFSVLCY